MGLRDLIVACTLLALCSADQIFTTVNSMLDPNRITWWRSKWAPAPVVLSVNNSGKTGVSATFFFCPTTTVTAGIFEVTFPSSFTLTGSLGASVNGVAVTGGASVITAPIVQVAATLSGGSDSQITITGIGNPSAVGAVGPFALRTRYFSDGQQVDVNLSFATVYIATATTNISNLKVQLANPTVNQVNKPSGTLSFQFNISTQLWRYDTFVINIDPSWTIASSATCNSLDYAGKYNNFNGTNTANPHSLQCITSARTTTSTTTVSTGLTTTTVTAANANVVYIYGLAVDGIDFLTSTDNQFVDLRVNSVTNPDSAGSTYAFTVSTFRFGTYTMLDTGTSTTVPTIIADTIASVSWVSTWGLNLATEAIAGQTYYFDLTVTLQNKLANGAVDIVITENFVSDANWVSPSCYVISPIYKYVVCSIASTTNLQITNLPDLASSSVVKVRVLVYFASAAGATAKIVTVKTYKGGLTGPQVDGGSSFGSFPLAATTAGGAASFSFSYLDSNVVGTTTITTAGGIPVTVSQKNTLQFGVYASTFSTAPTSATSFEIKCPMAGSISDMLIGVASPAYQFQQPAANTAVTAIAPSTSWATPTTAPTGVYTGTDTTGTSATPGSITFTGSVCGASCSVNAIFIQVVPSGTTAITLPKVATNIATAYECRLAITSTTSGVIPARTAIRFKVTPQPWYASSSLSVACLSSVNGMPVIFNLLTTIFTVAATATGQTYYVEFEFPTAVATVGFGAGLTAPTNTPPVGLLDAAMTYTGYIGAASTTTAVQLYTTASSTFVLFPAPAIPIYASGVSYVQFIFPIGGASTTASAFAPIARSFYLYNTDSRYKFINFETTFTGLSLTAAGSGTSFAATPGVISGSSILNGTTATATLNLNLVLTTAPVSAAYIYFVLPTGFSWGSSKAIKNLLVPNASGTTYTSSVYYFSVANPKFAFPGVAIYAYESSASVPFTATAGTVATITLAGLTPPLGVVSTTMTAVSGAPSNAACTGVITTLALSATVGTITITSVNPSSVTARGASGVNVHLAVAFQIAHGLPAGGSIVMAFDNTNWGVHSLATCGYCTVSGLTPAATFTTTTMCTLGAGSVTIANFADFQGSSPPAITIDIYGLLTPVTATGTGSGSNFVTSINTYTGTSYQGTNNQIDTCTGTGSAVTVTTAIAPAAITWTTKKTFPTTVSMLGVDLYLKFSIPHTLPRCGLITITSPLPYKLTGDLLNSCFLSPTQYWYCKINGSAIEIQVGQDYIGGTTMELYLDAAVDNASTTTASTTGFQITTTWGTQTIDTDGTTITSSQTIAATGSLTSTITGSSTASLTFVPKTSGEAATYTFDFKDSVNFAANDQYWIVFPPQYDYFLGDTWTWLTNEPNVYYIDCSSTQLGTTWCTVDHNIVVVTGSNAITGSTQIVISIQGVINPSSAAATSNFQIYHVDSNGSFVTVNQSYGTVTASAFASEIDVRSLVQSDRRIFKSSDMVWRLYIVDTVGTDGQLKVLFPREYDLNKFDKKDSYSCSSTWLDIGASATIKTQQSWNSASSCTASGNWITLGAPTASSTFSYTNIVTWTIQSVGNPQWGQPRPAVSLTQLDFDVTDAVLWPLDPMWASKFTFFVYKSAATSLTYSSRSYPNMNAAYAGFIMTYRQLLVNNYGPQMKTNRIVVRAGTQSTDYYISTSGTSYPMAAKQIVFTPTTNSRTPDSGKLKYTSVVDNWTLFQSFYKIQFRVAAGIDMIKGLYYIDWSNNETKQTGMSDVQYDIPCSTLVEVIAKTQNSSTFTVSTIPNVSTGYTSVPIKISIVNAPHTDCTINISVSGTPANISITPTALTFGPDVNEKYFQIQVASNYDLTLGTVQSLLFSLTGTDAYAFAIASSLKFTITQASTTITPGNIVSWGLGTPAKTIMSVTPSADQTGVIYYCLAAAGTVVPSFSSLKSSVQALVGANSTNSSPAPSVGANTQSDPQTGETWIDFQRRLYKTHLESTWTGSISMYATTAVKTLTFTWLYAATSYQISGYLDNLSSSTTDPTVRTETFTTTAVADCQPFVVKFQGTVASSFQTKISQEAANGMGVNPLRLINPVYATTTSRELDTTGTTTTVAFSTFTYTLLPNRFSESPAPADQAKLTGTALATFTAALIADGISNTLNSIANGAVPSRVTPQWTASPSSGGSTTNSVTVSLRANVAGQSCCVALTGTTTSPNPEQVMLGLDSTNTAASSTCITTDLTQSSNSVQVSSLQAGTAYYVYCSATDSYPMWPTQMSYSTTNPMAPVSITTLGSTTVVVTGASYFGGLFLLLAFLLH